jgi:hypothetical protein
VLGDAILYGNMPRVDLIGVEWIGRVTSLPTVTHSKVTSAEAGLSVPRISAAMLPAKYAENVLSIVRLHSLNISH